MQATACTPTDDVRQMGDGATRIDEQLQHLARVETRARGAGALFVAEGVPAKYVPLDEIQPPRFREVFAKTSAADGGKSAFTVLLDDGKFHVVKVTLDSAIKTEV